MDIIRVPQDFISFALEFANRKSELTFGDHYSDNGVYHITYLKDYIEPECGNPARIHNTNYNIQISKKAVRYDSPDFVYFILIVLYLTNFLNTNTDDKYSGNLLRCDLWAIKHCQIKGKNVKKIVGSAVKWYITNPTNLNFKRINQLVEFLKSIK